MWNYMFYIAYLKWKDPNEYLISQNYFNIFNFSYTGIESYISDKLEK